ncbi:Arc family DNA-binding protein [Xanthobacteraceae bacterium A53D]
MARDDLQVNLRMPAELKEALEEAARVSGRSLTAEVVRRLTSSFALVPKLEDNERRLMSLVTDLRRSQNTLEHQAQQLADLAERYADERNEAEDRVHALQEKLDKLKSR